MKSLIILFLSPVFCNAQIINASPAYVSTAPPRSYTEDSANFVNYVINQGGTLTSTEKTAIGTLIHQLIDSSLWEKMIAIYPMVGASSASCKANLRDTSKFVITWIGTPTFTASGVDFNGANGGNTNLLPTTAMSLNDAHLSYYSTENVANTSSLEIGATNPSSPFARTYIGIQSQYGIGQETATSLNNPDTRGLFAVSRTISSCKEYRNGISTSTSSYPGVVLPSYNIYIGGRNLGGSLSGGTTRNCAFASIGYGLTDAQSTTFYNIIQAFETALSRQV